VVEVDIVGDRVVIDDIAAEVVCCIWVVIEYALFENEYGAGIIN